MRHVARGSRIVIHGDYDVDGVCSTAVLARALRRLGADAGVRAAQPLRRGLRPVDRRGVERQAAAGTDLLVTVDCGITAVEEVAHARELGVEVVVTDHHRPGERAAGLHGRAPGARRLPVPGAVRRRRRVQARRGARRRGRRATRPRCEEDLDLVALATVCDVVPLVGENRRHRARRAGGDRAHPQAGAARADARGLVRPAARSTRARSASGSGRGSTPPGGCAAPDAALELLLTEDDARAGEIAGELDLLNRERQDTEMRITFAAEAELRARTRHEPRARARRRGLAPGRDRDRRLAAGRAPLPARAS